MGSIPTAIIFLGLVCIAPLGNAAERKAAAGLPADVLKFKERRDLCDHFRGEDPYDKERRKFLEENLKKYCAGADRDLAFLKRKYKNNEAVLKALAEYEENIE